MNALERWKEEMPKEEEMMARDKYTIFDRKAKRYRKGIHSTSTLSGETVESRDDGKSQTVLLTHTRTTEVDKSVPENQPARLLRSKQERRSETTMTTTTLAPTCFLSLLFSPAYGLACTISQKKKHPVYIEMKEGAVLDVPALT